MQKVNRKPHRELKSPPVTQHISLTSADEVAGTIVGLATEDIPWVYELQINWLDLLQSTICNARIWSQAERAIEDSSRAL